MKTLVLVKEEVILFIITIILSYSLDQVSFQHELLVQITIFTIAFSFISFFSIKKQRKILSILNVLANSSNSLNGTGEQILDSCHLINSSTNEQAGAVLETSSASDEISAMALRSLTNVTEAKKSISAIHDIILKSDTNASMLAKSYDDLALENSSMEEKLLHTVDVLQELRSLFTDVTNKTAVINDIVFQTKLLSFNASVEAARAGENGKGFAVVAEEIGNLANMSGESAKSIQDILDTTQLKVGSISEEISTNTKIGIRSMTEKINQGNSVITDFRKNFEKAKTQSVDILEQIEQVSLASDEQTKGIQELRAAIHLVNETIQRNSLVIGQTTDLAKVLSDEMDVVQSKLSLFRGAGTQILSDKIDSIPWLKKYELGIALIDEEHKELLIRINKLINAMNSDTNIQSHFIELANYTVKHFNDEEKYMESISYPSLESHKKVHENLLNSVNNFGKQIEKGSIEKTKLASFLKNWLFTHIMGVDIKYTEFGNKTKTQKVAS